MKSIALKILTMTLAFLVGVNLRVKAQEFDSTSVPRKLQVRAYVKDMQSLTFDKSFDSLVTGNLIHNRINLRWKANDKITTVAEVRTRLFWGEEVRLIPNFSSNINNSQETVNMNIRWIDTKDLVLHSTIDRLWMEYTTKHWDLRVGRQRINWGISTLWNPNDIFNTYNFLDFDYEERPGRDAVKFNYRISGMSNIEVAAASADRAEHTVAAVKYFTNVSNYDLQFSAGLYHQVFTAGLGWSGSIQQVGFKGELQYFADKGSTAGQLNASLEADYIFENGWYVNIGMLANSKGTEESISNFSPLYFQLSPQNLMPTKWNTVMTLAKEITPLLSGNVTMIYAPGTNLIIALPSVSYNLSTNLDFDLICQSFFAEQNNGIEGLTHRAYMRLKWSF